MYRWPSLSACGNGRSAYSRPKRTVEPTGTMTGFWNEPWRLAASCSHKIGIFLCWLQSDREGQRLHPKEVVGRGAVANLDFGFLKSVPFSALWAVTLAVLAKSNVLSEVVDGQRRTVSLVVWSGVAKSPRLKFLIPGSVVRVHPGVLDERISNGSLGKPWL